MWGFRSAGRTNAWLYDIPANDEIRGLRHIGGWESLEDWQRFHDERVEPAVHSVLSTAVRVASVFRATDRCGYSPPRSGAKFL
jgi:hypothetical protein